MRGEGGGMVGAGGGVLGGGGVMEGVYVPGDDRSWSDGEGIVSRQRRMAAVLMLGGLWWWEAVEFEEAEVEILPEDIGHLCDCVRMSGEG